MSAQSNLEIVQGAYAAFQRGDIDGLLGALAEDVAWTGPKVEGASFGGTYEGRAGVAKFFQDMMAEQEILEFVITDWIADGDKVVAVVQAKIRVRSTQKEDATTLVHISTVKDGKLANFLEVHDTASTAAAYRAD